MQTIATSAGCSTRSTERCALAAEALRQSGRLRMRVHGESMLPVLWPGDEVEIASCSLRDVRRGEIVLAFRDGQFCLHRFVAPRATGRFILCGDSLPGPDPLFPADALLGRLVRVANGEGRFFAVATRPGLGAKLSRAIGLLLCHFGIFRRLALRLHSRRRRPAPEFRSPAPA
jgi:hypothetical protein